MRAVIGLIKIYRAPVFLFTLVAAVSHAQTRPGPDNTGPTWEEDALALYEGPQTIRTDNTLIENVMINGQLTISANNVTIRNFIIRSENFYGIRIAEGVDALIEDGLIEGMQSAAILGSNFTARRLEIRDSGADAVKPGDNWVLEDSWLHKLGYIEDAHADGVQVVQGSNGVIRGNYFDMPHDASGYKNSQCMIIQTNNGTIDNILIENNWINGGGYSIQIRDKGRGHGAPANVSILNNRFGRDFQFGPWIIDSDDAITSGNVWDDTGEPLPDQTGGGDGQPPPAEQASAPIFSLASGAFLNPQTIAISSATESATIHYTLDGSSPEGQSPVYETPLVIDSTTHLQAMAVAEGMTDSFIASARYEIETFSADSEWENIALETPDGDFLVSFYVEPSSNELDAVFGLSLGPAENYSDLAAIVRLSPDGIIDARNGDEYQVWETFSYFFGSRYHITLYVSPNQGTYSVIAAPEGDESPFTIANDFQFRTEQMNITEINNIGFVSLGGNVELSSIILESTVVLPNPSPAPPPASTPTPNPSPVVTPNASPDPVPTPLPMPTPEITPGSGAPTGGLTAGAERGGGSADLWWLLILLGMFLRGMWVQGAYVSR